MKQIRKALLVISSSLFFLITSSSLFAGGEIIVTVKNEDIGNNLDLEAIISIFNQSDDLSNFERSLNDVETQISNIDYNHDGELDYLRPIEAIERHKQIIIIQAVLGDDLYYDIASIEILPLVKDKNETQEEESGESNISEHKLDVDTTVNNEANVSAKIVADTTSI